MTVSSINRRRQTENIVENRTHKKLTPGIRTQGGENDKVKAKKGTKTEKKKPTKRRKRNQAAERAAECGTKLEKKSLALGNGRRVKKTGGRKADSILCESPDFNEFN